MDFIYTKVLKNTSNEEEIDVIFEGGVEREKPYRVK